MANRRMINTFDFSSLEYNTLTLRQRYLFCGLVLFADDDGVMAVRFVKSRVFPLDEEITIDEVFEDLKQLQTYNFIILYDGDEYLQICDWWSRQFIDIKQYKQTKYPKPPMYQIRPVNLKKYSYNNDHSRKLLEQNREDECSSGKHSSYKKSLNEKNKVPEYPFDSEGNPIT